MAMLANVSSSTPYANRIMAYSSLNWRVTKTLSIPACAVIIKPQTSVPLPRFAKIRGNLKAVKRNHTWYYRPVVVSAKHHADLLPPRAAAWLRSIMRNVRFWQASRLIPSKDHSRPPEGVINMQVSDE
ncbi:hypothetical protein HJFPF1_08113 [Paramyrothecium foliicola]|nr:hypothetical protein HJFPF1_08113 [Paramyrothecium foliicola]